MSPEPTRRRFLGTTAGLVPLAALAVSRPAWTQPGLPPDNHMVPVEKGLDRAWLDGLRAKGQPAWYRGADLERIGMPVGGIGCGQLYLHGDGSLGAWRIFNRPTGSQPEVASGFALGVSVGGERLWRSLDRQGFGGVSFRGEYPIGRVRYFDWGLPVRVELTAFTPWIPLRENDSNLPATVFEFEVENTADEPVVVELAGWLENAVGLNSGPRQPTAGARLTTVATQRGRGVVVHDGVEVEPPVAAAPRPAIMLGDFEGPTWDPWVAEGEAFGTGPAKGTLPNQQPVSGFDGAGLVNSFVGGDDPQGRLTSPEFTVNRDFLNFLVGGGAMAGRTCVNLVVDGEVVRTATGRNNELLEPHTWDVRDLAGRTATIVCVDEASGPWGHINADSFELADVARSGFPPFAEWDDAGTLTLMAEGAAEPLGAGDGLELPLELVGGAGARYGLDERRAAGLRSTAVELAPGAKHTFRYVLAWYFPNAPDWTGGRGHWYAARFADAAAVAHHVFDDLPRLAAETKLWRDTYYDSTLPWWLLDRLHAPLANLSSGTCRWFHDGRFWAWEGVNCCDGTCTHVWNYAHAQARLFPGMERLVRERQDLGEAFDPETGLVQFRGSHAGYAADGQAGTVLKAYRDYLLSADDSWLKRHWPRIKKVLEFSIGRDGNDNGLIEDSQHNTYDINFEGPNTFVGALYLAACRAGERMARAVGDTAFASRCAAIVRSGRELTMERLYNGEYFIQEVDLGQHPSWQYAEGCLADQMFGQGWAHHVGLGYLYPAEAVRSALEAVWKYNFAPDIGPQNVAHPPERWFIWPGEPGLFICTWPISRHLENDGVRYRDEVWTGIEYQVAGGMVWEGLLDEALTICRAVHDRYAPDRRNPYNEIECCDHYARALASWGVYTALCGFDYHGPEGRIAFDPQLTPEAFRAAFTTAEGWGTFEQTRADEASQTDRLTLAFGTLRLRELAFQVPAGVTGATVWLDGRQLPATANVGGGRLGVALAEAVTLNAGQTLEVRAAAR